ncbi:MAG TPA: MmgE/PrpD family protein, partial [Desulfobacteraceae bacterium]|nr:MmgE/PrpD family protein [Desulfobacteraceae bacterium]
MNSSVFEVDRLVAESVSRSFVDIPERVMHKARGLFVDTIGCLWAGTSAEGIPEVRETMLLWGGTRHATVLGFGDRISAPNAALLHGVMIHARDFDDTHDTAVNHGCVVVVPALLATAEAVNRPDPTGHMPVSRRKISGTEFIAALAVGLEVANRFGMAFIHYLHPGWLPTTLWGAFGAAAACGRLLGLDEAGMRNAFGFAYAQIHANRQALADARLAKRIQVGFSGSAGVQSSFLAARGLTAARHIISGAFGVPQLYTSGRMDPGYVETGLGNFEQTLRISVKPYPCCRCTHPVIDAALEIKRKKTFDPSEIESATAYLPPQSMAQIGSPFVIRDNPTVDAQFSAAYAAAHTFLYGAPGISDFSPEHVRERAEVKELASRISSVEFEKDSSAVIPAELHVTLRGGETLSARIEAATGSPERPLSHEQEALKFFDCLDASSWNFSLMEKERKLELCRSVLEKDDIVDFVDKL